MKPRNIKPDSIPQLNMQLIREYQTTSVDEPYLEVQVVSETKPSEAGDIKKWFESKLKILNATLVNESKIQINNVEGYNVLFSRTLKGGEEYVSRASMLTIGNTNMVVIAMSSKTDYKKLDKTILHILTNWGIQKR